ncbi:hypothetical protein C477_01490 [Haloterrigena salina JCM 13891]|uniref:Uncharacterized protein n=1 Tax=Haloterrigena salina JCM 13891 TaxID=1227488 RepID=M0CKL8_9EURY|nr:hypothetical protein [Haloterrigena salina]ELZ23830.1 hypothetical protein C477_01490 [Haloterrigena salina JCM 13891]
MSDIEDIDQLQWKVKHRAHRIIKEMEDVIFHAGRGELDLALQEFNDARIELDHAQDTIGTELRRREDRT